MVLIVTYANKRNQFLDEWEKSVKRRGFEYKILGIGDTWNGWKTRTDALLKYLKTLNKNRIIVFCDAFDLLFLNGNQKKLLKTYLKMAKDKILLGSDPYCLPHNCLKDVCDFENGNLNAGFVMGKVSDILEAYEFIKNFDDDQIGWNEYAKKNCDIIVLDKNTEVVIDFYPEFHTVELNKQVSFKDNKTQRITEPFAVHLPAQFYNSDSRSELIRNHLFKHRDRFSGDVYFENLLRSYKLNWGTFILILLSILLFIFVVLKSVHVIN